MHALDIATGTLEIHLHLNNHIRLVRRLCFPNRQAVIDTCEEHTAIRQLIREHNKTQAPKHIRKSQELGPQRHSQPVAAGD